MKKFDWLNGDWDALSIEVLDSGDLRISFTKEGHQDYEDGCFGEPASLSDVLEGLLCNSGMDLVDGSFLGMLTEAPVLIEGMFLSPSSKEIEEYNLVVVNKEQDVYVERWAEYWAYMDYQIRDPLEEICKYGYVIFTYYGSLVK